MKSTIFTLFSVLVLGHGVQAQAEGLFAKAFHGKLSRAATEQARRGEIGPTIHLSEAEAADELGMIDGTDASLTAISSHCGCEPQCDTGCFGGGCGNGDWMCPGTGAWGGDSRLAGSITIGTDTFFGLYPIVAGAYALNEFVDITAYSWVWTSEALSAIPGLSRGPWTEFGGGLNFKYMGGALNINPQFGVLNGALLSSTPSGSFDGGNEPRVFDGVVPTLTINYDDDLLESQFYMGYYAATRGQSELQNDFLHWWVNGGIKPWGDESGFRSMLSTGLHYEMLRNTRSGDNLYAAVAPYMQLAFTNGLSFRYTAGWNTDRGQGAVGRNFYKLWATYSF